MPSVLTDEGPNSYDLTLASTSGWDSPGAYGLPNGDVIQNNGTVTVNPGYRIVNADHDFYPWWGVNDYAIEVYTVTNGQDHTVVELSDSTRATKVWDITNSSSGQCSLNLYYSSGVTSWVFGGGGHLVANITSTASSWTTGVVPIQLVRNNVVVRDTAPASIGMIRTPTTGYRFWVNNPRTSGLGGSAPRGKISLYRRLLTLEEIDQRYLTLTTAP